MPGDPCCAHGVLGGLEIDVGLRRENYEAVMYYKRFFFRLVYAIYLLKRCVLTRFGHLKLVPDIDHLLKMCFDIPFLVF